MLAWMGDQRDEALEEGHRVKDEGPRAVAPGAPQGPFDLAVAANLEPALGESWAGDIADQALESVAIFGLDAGRGVQRIASGLAAELVSGRDDRLLRADGARGIQEGVVSGRPDVGAMVELDVDGNIAQGTFVEPFEVLWFSLRVGILDQPAASFCPGDGTAGTCACGNSAVGQNVGCLNSLGRGAHLYARRFLSSNRLIYEMEDLPPQATALIFASLTTSAGRPVFGGNVCLGAGVRLQPVTAVEMGFAASSASLLGSNGFLAGSTAYAQAAYRDPGGATQCIVNFTNGEAILLQP